MIKSYSNFLLIEATEKSSQDSLGKLHEVLVGRELNGGLFSTHHRSTVEGTPEEVHNRHARALYGDDYKNHPGYKNAVKNAQIAARDIHDHLTKNGVTKIKKVAWTSQPSDHAKETGVEDPNSTADLIVTGHDGKQVGVSLKTGQTKTPNYKNPGVATYEKWSGRKLTHLADDHSKVLQKHGSPSHQEYKKMRDNPDHRERQKADEIKKSSDNMNRKMAGEIHKGLSDKSHEELHKIIKDSVAPATHLNTIVSHTVVDSGNKHISHDVHDHQHHIDSYLNNFHDLHVKPHVGGTSVSIMGRHKKTGKLMKVWNTTVYAGGRPSNKLPRGATQLPSEAKVK